MGKRKRLSVKAYAKMTPEQRLERERLINVQAQRRFRKKHTLAQRQEKRRQDDARCYDWAQVLPHIDKQPDGCWIWRGPYALVFGRARPVVRAGAWGKQLADLVVACLHRGKGLPHGCFVRPSCGKVECVAPEHLLLTNAAVERAKRRRANHGQTEELRAVPRRDEPGDDGRSRGGRKRPQRSAGAATGD